MRKEKALINLLQSLVKLLAEEATSNPEFAKKLETLLAPIPESPGRAKALRKDNANIHTPDIYAEWHARGEGEFRLWLRDEPLEVMRALVRQHDLDPSRRTARWNEREKLSAYIADQLRARLSRGSQFMRD